MDQKSAIIIGNGPSLPGVPRAFLDSLLTYGGNLVGRYYNPTYYICIDRTVVIEPEIIPTARAARVAYLRNYDDGVYHPRALYRLPNVELVTRKDYVFAGERHHSGCTLVYVALKIAFVNFDTVYLVGVDNSSGHFYTRKEKLWNDGILTIREEHYRIARREYARAGKRIINLSPPSALDAIFERGKSGIMGA